MEPLPIPCPAHLIPDVTGAGGFTAAYRQAKAEHAVFVAIENQGQWWTVKADTLTAGPGYAVGDTVNDAARSAITRLVQAGEVRSDAHAGPVYFVLHGVDSEERARELAATLHAALYGDAGPLASCPRSP
ncbi:hypothetical protein [Streptomyces deccanensis]|uniref:hypothetical protein n=1 Tax=Streptomyces deccanensis TaxID=424188 RepID=UPI001EFC1806|nr:hypothetical protein [Streptomyces deccanensis]ULR52263.1 hypothetical protein L3078_24905 [Streptomyces deccanensis]